MSVIIKEISSKSELKKFVEFGIDLYKDDKNFCPPLVFDEVNTLRSDKNPAFDFCESIYFLAYIDNKIVGRIAGIINHRANEKWAVKKLRFGWFDFIDNLKVSKALLDAVLEWGKQKGMSTFNGPVGFTDMDHQGLLLEGFEYPSPMIALYNYPYYIKHFEAYGLTKEADWIELRCTVPTQVPEKMARVAKIVTEKYHIKIAEAKSAKQIIAKYGYEFFDVIDEAYKDLYNYSPLTEKQKAHYSKMFIPILNFDFFTLVTNEKDEIVGVGITMPNISSALQKCRGKLFPIGWYHLIKALKSKNMQVVDLLLIAVRPDYQNKGINALFFTDQIPQFNKYGVKYADVTAVLEDNSKNLANYSLFEHKVHKRRRAYIKQIEN